MSTPNLPNTDPSLLVPRMPEVDVPVHLEETFAKARKSAAEGSGAGATAGRHVVIVTPGRMLMLQPCPAPGSMDPKVVASVEKLLAPQPPKNIAAVGFTELTALRANLGKAIPFFGTLLGLAYIGHAVWVFEGHPTALAAGCREADLLLVDELMVPFLDPYWVSTMTKVMRRPLIFSHERATFTLRRLHPPAAASAPAA